MCLRINPKNVKRQIPKDRFVYKYYYKSRLSPPDATFLRSPFQSHVIIWSQTGLIISSSRASNNVKEYELDTGSIRDGFHSFLTFKEAFKEAFKAALSNGGRCVVVKMKGKAEDQVAIGNFREYRSIVHTKLTMCEIVAEIDCGHVNYIDPKYKTKK